jgi:hypothetical protein
LVKRGLPSTARNELRNHLRWGAALHPNGRSFGLLRPASRFRFRQAGQPVRRARLAGETGSAQFFKTAKLSYCEKIVTTRNDGQAADAKILAAVEWVPKI